MLERICLHIAFAISCDSAFVKLIRERNVGYGPTLTLNCQLSFMAIRQHFLMTLFFARIQRRCFKPLNDPSRQLQIQNDRHANTYRRQLPVAMSNLKQLSDAGIPIVFGTDSGVPTRFMGYFEHVEMQTMADAGLSPMQIIVSATKTVSDQLGLKGLGILAVGNRADFLVLDKDPLKDIRNTRTITAVFIGRQKLKSAKSTPEK